MRSNSAEVIAAYIAAAGTTQVFAYPGDPIIELLEQLRRKEVEVVLARREGSAGFMAEAWAMVKGQVGVAMSTLGPGSTALVNPVAAATLDRVPMLAISGQVAVSREQFLTHQVIDHKLLYSGVSKWAGRVDSRAVPTIMRKALRIATAERPGAVHLTCPADTMREEATPDDVAIPPLGSTSVTIEVLRGRGVAPPAKIVAGARRPIVLAGIGAMRANATASLIRAAETIGAPVIVSPMSKGVFPEDHPLFAGVIDMACNQVVWNLMERSDLIIAAGFDAVELINPWSLKAPVLHIDSLANTDQIYESDCELLGDVGEILNWLSDGWNGEQRWSDRDISAHRELLRSAYYSGRVEGRLSPTDVVDIVQGAVPRATTVTVDVGSHKLLVGQGWRAYEPRHVLMTNGLSAMGFGVPAAIGAALARPAELVVALVGDGGFAMTSTEVRLAAQLRLPIVVVVFVDGSLNRIELKQRALGYPSTATRIEGMDIASMANAMECDGVRVRSSEELADALAGVGALSRPLVIEAHIDPSQYESQF